MRGDVQQLSSNHGMSNARNVTLALPDREEQRAIFKMHNVTSRLLRYSLLEKIL